MANKLKNMRLTSVDLVRRGANQEADICIVKGLDDAPEEDPNREAPRASRTISKTDTNRIEYIEEVRK